jgi:parallel beta-helix repeat protein
LATVAKAIAVAKAGATIVVGAGTYHETLSIPSGKGLTIQSAPNAAVWFDGSSVVTGWVASGSTWVKSGWTAEFDATPSYTGTVYTQQGWGFVNPSYPMAAHPDQVWIDGTALTQVASESAVVAGTFYTDYAGNRLVIGSNPTAHEVRASDLGIAMTITGANTTLRGVGIRRYATAVHDMGGIRVLGANSVIENVTITDMATTGISMLSAGDRVSHITLQRNGMLGMHGNQADGIVIENVLSTDNNTEHFNNSPVSGGIKISRTRTVTLRNSVLKDNYGPGLWLDESVYNSTVTGNLITNNAGHGFSIEICDTSLIANNTITDNRSDGLKINDTGNVKLWNNTFGGNGTNIEMLQDSRDETVASTQGHDPRQPIPDPTMPWKVNNISVMNTILLQSDSHTTINIRDYTNTRSATQMNIKIDGNLFTRAASGEVLAVWQESGSTLTLARTVADITKTGAGTNNKENVVGQAPNGAAASSFAQPLPADVASAIGQPTGTRQVGAF